MKLYRILATGVLVTGLISPLNLPVAHADNSAGEILDFGLGNYQFHARARQANGLFRDVVLISTDPKTARTSTMYAKFARQDAAHPTRWILGQVVIHHTRKDKTVIGEARAKRMIFDWNKS